MRCRQPLTSIRLMVRYFVEDLHNHLIYAHIVHGGGTGHLVQREESRFRMPQS